MDFTGDMEKTRQFLDDLKIKGNVESLARDDLAKLCTALTLKLLMQGSFAADSIMGEVIRLKHEVVENSLEMVQLLNACGNRDVPGLGLTLCLRDTGALEQARSLAQEYKGHILREIGMLREQNKVLTEHPLPQNGEYGSGSYCVGTWDPVFIRRSAAHHPESQGRYGQDIGTRNQAAHIQGP